MARRSEGKERKQCGLRLEVDLVRKLQHLAVDEGKRMNDLVEEAIQDLLKKYHEKLARKRWKWMR